MLQWISGRPEEARWFFTAVQCNSTLLTVLLGGGTDFCSSELTKYVSCFSVAIKHHDQEQFKKERMSFGWWFQRNEPIMMQGHDNLGQVGQQDQKAKGVTLSISYMNPREFENKESLSFSKMRTWLSDFFALEEERK